MNKPTRALIDGDILVYRVGFSCERKGEELSPEFVARARLNEALDKMLDAVDCANFDLFLTSSDKSNYRFDIAPDYKANRVAPKPKHYEYIRHVMREEYGAITVDNEEADDALGYNTRGDETVICSIDKDLDQISGWHFNFVKETMYYITKLEAARWFYQQILIGDTSDNIKGCPKVGAIGANRILEGCQDEKEMLHAVMEQYRNRVKEDWLDALYKAGSLLWIRKEPKQGWILPNTAVASKESLGSFLNFMESASDTSQQQSSM